MLKAFFRVLLQWILAGLCVLCVMGFTIASICSCGLTMILPIGIFMFIGQVKCEKEAMDEQEDKKSEIVETTHRHMQAIYPVIPPKHDSPP